MTRPTIYTVTTAAQRMCVSPRTIRAWVAAGHLVPLPLRGEDGKTLYFTGPALADAERENRRGRVRRHSGVAV